MVYFNHVFIYFEMYQMKPLVLMNKLFWEVRHKSIITRGVIILIMKIKLKGVSAICKQEKMKIDFLK